MVRSFKFNYGEGPGVRKRRIQKEEYRKVKRKHRREGLCYLSSIFFFHFFGKNRIFLRTKLHINERWHLKIAPFSYFCTF